MNAFLEDRGTAIINDSDQKAVVWQCTCKKYKEMPKKHCIYEKNE